MGELDVRGRVGLGLRVTESSHDPAYGAGRVVQDLAENHGRAVARAFVRDVADAVAAVAPAAEEDWQYELPALEESVATVTIGLDGTCMLMCADGWRPIRTTVLP